jgi:Sulfatase-modifying factor enzyme 1
LNERRYKRQRDLICLVALVLPLQFLAVAAPDSHEVTNLEYLQFLQATGHSPPEYWINGRYPPDRENKPVVLVNWHDATSHCRWAGKRLPTADEWMALCQVGKIKKQGDIWEWTSTDVVMGHETFKALCGPRDSCDCSHRYLPAWKNEVKGFRCFRDSAPVTWLPLFFTQERSS